MGRYHLYVALICPWASRTLIGRKLKKLDHVISVSVVEPALTDQGWRFGDYTGSDKDDLNGATFLHEIYMRATVPVLWDKRRGTIVSNESPDILRMLDSGFGALADESVDLYPASLRDAIDALNARIYPSLNNGVYQTGFATIQAAYEEAVADVFPMLDELDQRLADGRDFLFGEAVTEADIRLFVTLVRFDPAYHGLFKANLLADFPRLSASCAPLTVISFETEIDSAAVQSNSFRWSGLTAQARSDSFRTLTAPLGSTSPRLGAGSTRDR